MEGNTKLDPFLQEKLWDLGINILSVLIGGGLIVGFVEWQRHRREQQQWQREQSRVEIDIPRADIVYSTWVATDNMPPEQQLMIYKNELIGKVQDYVILVDFVIRNTTNGEQVITSYGASDIVQTGTKEYQLYDLKTVNKIDTESLPVTSLEPLGIIARTALIINSIENPRQKVDTPPTHVIVYAQTSEGIRTQKEVRLKEVEYIPIDRGEDGQVYLTAYLETFRHLSIGQSFPAKQVSTRNRIASKPTVSQDEITEDEIPF